MVRTPQGLELMHQSAMEAEMRRELERCRRELFQGNAA